MDPYGDDWLIYPVDGYGSPEVVRTVLTQHKPDVVWFMTDPRFYVWLWEMEDEIRSLVPVVYYHVWDNYPYPTFNKNYYDSCDVIATISKVTDDIVKTVSPDTESVYIPHAVNSEVFKPLDKEVIKKARQDVGIKQEQTLFFWNNRIITN